MEIRIGIANTGRELNFETSEPAADVKKSVASALDAGATHVSFTDAKGTNLALDGSVRATIVGPFDGARVDVEPYVVP